MNPQETRDLPDWMEMFLSLSIAGAFLIPFVLMVLIIALPIFFSELYVGQYSGIGPVKAYARLAPFFQGEWRS